MPVGNEIDPRVRPWRRPSGDRTLVERRERIARRCGASRGGGRALSNDVVRMVGED